MKQESTMNAVLGADGARGRGGGITTRRVLPSNKLLLHAMIWRTLQSLREIRSHDSMQWGSGLECHNDISAYRASVLLLPVFF